MLFRDHVGTKPYVVVGQMPIQEKKKNPRSLQEVHLYSLSERTLSVKIKQRISLVTKNDCCGNNKRHHLLSTNCLLSTTLLNCIHYIV